MELKARERAVAFTGVSKESQQVRRKPSSITSVPTATTLMTDSEEIKCCYCLRNNHCSEMCRTVKGTEARKRKLREGGRCFKCLRRGHIASQCRTGLNCSSCGGRHHVSLCLQSAKPQSRPTQSASNSTSKMTHPQSTTGAGTQSEQSLLDPRAPSFAGNYYVFHHWQEGATSDCRSSRV